MTATKPMTNPQAEPVRKGLDLSMWRELYGFTKPYKQQVRLLMLNAVITAST